MYIERAAVNASYIDFVMNFVHFWSIVPFLIVNAVLIYLIIRYRRRSAEDKTSKIAHNTRIEILWSVIPSIVFIVMFVLGAHSFYVMRAAPADAVEIHVTASKWRWEFAYPARATGLAKSVQNDKVLLLPDKKPIKLILKSKDVLHSFFVPAFRVKEDVVPNMFTYVHFTPDTSMAGTNEFDIFCTEFCGLDHSYMLARVRVLPETEWKNELQKLEAAAGEVSVAAGKAIFDSNCIACHSLDGSRKVGPSFKGLFNAERKFLDGSTAIADENYIIESMKEPNKKVVEGFPPAMPAQTYSDAQLRSVLEYIKEIK